LDQDVDLDSIRVDGRGPATITDIQTEIVPQRDRFEDVYPDESDEDATDAEDPDNEYGVDKSAYENACEELEELQEALAKARNEQNTSVMSLGFLDNYGKTMAAKDVEVSKMDEFLSLYLEQRAKLGDSHQRSSANIAELEREIERLSRKVTRLHDGVAKAINVASKEDRRAREKRWKDKEQKRKAKQRVRNEQKKFWPYNVSQVVLHLDGFSGFTPGSSRRSSIISGKKPDPTDTEESDGQGEFVSLSLTYVTNRATWAPRYELSLKTPTSSGKIVYRAEFQNSSSETWRDAKVILSTSQTSFSGLDEKIPSLQAWHVKLGKGAENVAGQRKDANWSGGLENKVEISARLSQNAYGKGSKAFGNNTYANNTGSLFGNAVPRNQATGFIPQQQVSQQMPQSQVYSQAAPSGGGLFGSSAPSQSQSLFGSVNPASNAFGGFGNTAAAESHLGFASDRDGSNVLADEEEPDLDTDTLSGPSNVLAFQESLRQDYGLTTTYDLPGQRTLRPSSLKRRHVIAELDLSSINLSHVLIPKLRPAAFLRARVKNTSNVTLLRGKAGLTLDGTFLGSTTIPTCTPDNAFNLSLGVDPSILVTYAKPTVRRATSGFFNKEDCAVFTRVCWIKNTKGSSISILVLDQVPVSEDERLRVNILDPKGLEKEGDKTKLDIAKGSWGKGTATMGKGGELKWEITLDKGKDVKLILEYEARIPSGQKIVGLD
jgi:hypothetical protein